MWRRGIIKWLSQVARCQKNSETGKYQSMEALKPDQNACSRVKIIGVLGIFISKSYFFLNDPFNNTLTMSISHQAIIRTIIGLVYQAHIWVTRGKVIN